MLLLFFLRSSLLLRWEISQAKENKSKLVVSLVYYVCFCLITEKKKAVVSKKGRKKKLHIQKTSRILCAKKLGKTKKNAISTGVLCCFFVPGNTKSLFLLFLTFCFLKRKLHRKLKRIIIFASSEDNKSEILWNKEKVVVFQQQQVS